MNHKRKMKPVVFVDFLNTRQTSVYNLANDVSYITFKRMMDLGYFPDYLSIDNYIRDNGKIVGGWITCLSAHLRGYDMYLVMYDGSEESREKLRGLC